MGGRENALKKPPVLACGIALTALCCASQVAGQDREARAVRIETPPRVDGVLDEPFWAAIPPVTGFKQRDPVDGAPPSERTEVRIAYDRDNLYFGLKLFDSEPDRILRNILDRGGRISKDDRIVVALDTYLDRRNGYIFEIGSLGTQDDALFTDESLERPDWNWDGVFTTETTVNAEGWVLEMAIPFTTIRFADVEEPVMGIAIQRSIRRKNENVYWPHIGQDFVGGIAQASQYATLTGLKDVRRGHRLEVKPYASLGGQQLAGEPDLERQSKAGLDLKYGLTSNLTLDLTWNTDFAQVETDNVQINLTRFDLFFPEKREFFLERAGLFEFGTTRETEVFFSRRVGLDGDIQGGARLTGQAGPLSVGALALRTGGTPDSGSATGGSGVPAAWNSVLRLQANLRERTTAGVIATSLDRAGGSSNRVAGADFHTRFWTSSSFRVWGARLWDSVPDGSGPGKQAARAELDLENDRYALSVDRVHVGRDFDPALGFVRRRDMDEWQLWGGFRPRFERSGWARRFSVWGGGVRTLGTGGELQSERLSSNADFLFESGERVSLVVDDRFERLHGPASISGRALPPGDYSFRFWEAYASTNESRMFSIWLEGSRGDFWSGRRTRYGGRGVVKTGRHLTVGLRLARNDVSLPVANGDFTTTLIAVDLVGAVSRKLFAAALVQWDNLSHELQANIRIDWIHTPGSDLFLALDTGYITDDNLDPRFDPWTRRTAVAKLTWLKAF
ncbi:MAG: carbohydrate binding family 9 domain-containing protein [Acidobacteria bacterium]|nr:carbohydrate binding family 9 domain-containing protein [Acidobacteriota bacterium]MYF14551.1 carbohydrate binding family 9 domain-containing protein [Acidobacteriota bacterium]MYI96732.1 carbohydrate binding family 9 domain-containing protein [Acidobacteriota bacterium]